MAKDKKSFIAYCDWLESFEELSDEEAGKLVKHLLRYVNDKNPEAPDKLTKMCFIPIQQSLKRDLKKYEGYIQKQRENGAKGGRPRKPKKPNGFDKNPTEPKKADSVNVSVNDSVSVIDSDNVNEDKDVIIVNNCVEFSEFWELYDKKVGKTEAQKKWKKLKESEKEAILNHVPKYVHSTPDKQFRKNATTYLNQQTWLDEDLPTATNSNGQPIKQETKEDREAREFMENINAYNTHKTLYGEESANAKFNFNENVQSNNNNNRLA